MKRLIVNADDFGLSESINRGIIKCFQDGIITSTTIMVNQPHAKHAYKLWKDNRALAVGLHLTLDRGKALTGISSLTDKEGNFLKSSELLEKGKDIDYHREIRAQLQKYNDIFGCDPTHIDSHHHIHLFNPGAFKALKMVEREFGIKFRRQKNLLEKFYGENLTVEILMNLLNEKKNEDLEYIELMTHPSFMDKNLMEITSYNIPRTKELEILTSAEIKEFVNERFILQTYRDI